MKLQVSEFRIEKFPHFKEIYFHIKKKWDDLLGF